MPSIEIPTPALLLLPVASPSRKTGCIGLAGVATIAAAMAALNNSNPATVVPARAEKSRGLIRAPCVLSCITLRYAKRYRALQQAYTRLRASVRIEGSRTSCLFA